MPIGTSDGEYFDNRFEAMVGSGVTAGLKRVPIVKDPEVIPPPQNGDYGMVVNPNSMMLGKEMDQIEVDPSSGLGLEINSRMPLGSPTEPAGALKQEEGTRVAPPDNFDTSVKIDWSRMNEPLGSIKGTGKEDTPVVAKAAGGIKITEGDINQAIDVAGSFGTGTIGGVRAATLNKEALKLAQTAESQGFDADQIWKSTGFFRGADKRWRHEIDDSGSKFFPENIKGGNFLSDVLHHPALFEAYPQLKLTRIRIDPSKGEGASWNGNTIVLGDKAAKDKGILVHEIQHAIQDIEGFAKGGTPGRVQRDFQVKYEEDINKLRPLFLDLQTKTMRGEALSPLEEVKLDRLKAIFKKYVEYTRAADAKAREHYLELAGETEARNVQTRVDLGPVERQRFNPLDTEDTSRAKQIVKKDASLTTPYVIGNEFHSY